MCVHISRFSHVQLFATLLTIAHKALLSMGFSRQEYWSGLPCPPRGSSRPRDQTQVFYVSCVGRCVPYHCNIKLKVEKNWSYWWNTILFDLCTSLAKNTFQFLILYCSGKEHTCQRRRHKRRRFDPWVKKGAWQPTSVFFPRESHGKGSLAVYSP